MQSSLKLCFLAQISIYSKSKLRESAAPTLGSQYSGSKISREAFVDGLDSPGHVENDDGDPFAHFAKRRRNGSDTASSSGFSNDMDEDEQAFDDPDTVAIDWEGDIGDDEEVDSENAFGEGDEELLREKGFTFRGSGSNKPASRALNAEESDEDSEDGFGGFGDYEDAGVMDSKHTPRVDAVDETDSDEEDDIISDNTDIDTEGSSREEDESTKSTRAALRELMADEQKSIIASITEATEADAAKGTAVKQQYSTFDTLVATRIQLQKAIVAMNSLSAESSNSPISTETNTLAAAAESAESAAVKLLNSLNALSHSFETQHQSTSKEPRQSLKRPFSVTVTTPSTSISSALSSLATSTQSRHRSTLTKWSQKTQPVSSLAKTNRLLQPTSQQALTSLLDSHLQEPSLDRLITHTQNPRSCAPLQTTSTTNTHDTTIFDDTDFYSSLLRELIEHKKSFATSDPNAILEAASSLAQTKRIKQRKKVEPRTSKGRKMRFTVHEKLLNFMVPQEPPATAWARDAAVELFRGLFGERGAVGERDGDENGDMDADEEREVEGLKLFAGR